MVAGMGGQPAIRTSTGRIVSSGPASSRPWPDIAAERGDEPGFGHRFVGGPQRGGHADGDRAGDEQHVGGRGEETTVRPYCWRS
jgi:hypothetical protein